jgi:hypothetical protein
MTLRPCLVCGTPADGSYCPTHKPYAGNWQQQSKAQRKRTPWCQCPGCPSCSPSGCWRTSDLCADHIRSGDPSRLQTLCRRCNSSKQ